MALHSLRFAGLGPTWDGTAKVADVCLPFTAQTCYGRLIQAQARDLLRALVMVAIETGGPTASLATVRNLIDAEQQFPHLVLEALMRHPVRQVRLAAAIAARTRGCSMADSVRLLDETISEQRFALLRKAWPGVS